MELSLVLPKSEYLEAYYEYYLDGETRRYDPFPAPSIETLKERLAKASSNFSELETARSFFWFVSQSDKIVAHVSLHNLNPMMMTAEIGFGVFPAAREKGIATASIQLVSRKAFAESPLRKLIAFVHEENRASRKALESAGFKQEGLFRESYMLHGLPANEAVYGLLRSDGRN